MKVQSFLRIVFAACLLLAVLLAPANAEPDKVRLRLDWAVTGYQLPFYWAAKNNYYRDAGLDVEIAPGAGSQQTINLVGGGHDDLGLADYSLVAVSVARGMRVKAIYGIIQDDAWSIYSHSSNPITKPSDLSGKSVVCIVDHKPLLDLFLRLSKIDPATVQIRTVDAATRNAVFAQGETDALVAVSIGTATTRAVDTKRMPMSAYGVNLLGQGLIVNQDFMRSHPDAVRRFVEATMHAVNDLLDERKAYEGARIALAATGSSVVQADVVRQGWVDTIARLHSNSTRNMPPGWMSESDWNDMQKILRESGRISEAIPAGQLFTNDFIPRK